MGKSSNFAIIPARLIVDEKDHGIQMFIVQLRDLDTHQPLPGMFYLQLHLLWWKVNICQTLYCGQFTFINSDIKPNCLIISWSLSQQNCWIQDHLFAYQQISLLSYSLSLKDLPQRGGQQCPCYLLFLFLRYNSRRHWSQILSFYKCNRQWISDVWSCPDSS